MTLSQDILAELAEIAPDSALAAARAVRKAATHQPTMPGLGLPIRPRRGWFRRRPLPGC